MESVSAVRSANSSCSPAEILQRKWCFVHNSIALRCFEVRNIAKFEVHVFWNNDSQLSLLVMSEEDSNVGGDPEICKNPDDTDTDSDDADDSSQLDRYWPPPTTQTAELAGSIVSKTVSAFSFSNSGTRFAAGGHDHEIRIWDFGVLDPNRPESICSSQPCGQTVVKNLDYSIDDELILVTSGSCQAVIVAKDAIVAKEYQCPKGDQYLKDMQNTKGHVQMLNDGRWNPKDRETFITCSNDATVRIWDLNKLSQQKTVIKTRSPINGLKSVPNVCCYSRDALSIVAGCNDGSILMWDTRRKFISTSACIKNAHLKGSEIIGIDFSYGSNKLCTRSEDESCKIWDLRQLKQALATRTGLTSSYSTTDCSFSPDDRFIITGSSCTKDEPGQLHFLDANSELSIKHTIDVPGASVIRSKWHPKINHIGYSCSNGALFICYDKTKSIGGFLGAEDAINRGLKRKKYQSQRDISSSSTAIKKIITPHSLPMFKEDQVSTSFAKIRQDPKRSYKPQLPMT